MLLGALQAITLTVRRFVLRSWIQNIWRVTLWSYETIFLLGGECFVHSISVRDIWVRRILLTCVTLWHTSTLHSSHVTYKEWDKWELAISVTPRAYIIRASYKQVRGHTCWGDESQPSNLLIQSEYEVHYLVKSNYSVSWIKRRLEDHHSVML